MLPFIGIVLVFAPQRSMFPSSLNTLKRSRVAVSEENRDLSIQGGSLRTWTFRSPVKCTQIVLSSDGRPYDADIEVWQGPDNTPLKARVYGEDGRLRPFSTVVDIPNDASTITIRNIAQLEFPLIANVNVENVDVPSAESIETCMVIQGGALRTYPFDAYVESVQVLLRTEGRPLNARIELLQGPCNNKQVIELYTENGGIRPFFCMLATPGPGNVVRIVNTAPMEFPMIASVVPHTHVYN